MKTIADVSVGRDNNFNLLRMLAAAAVLVSHSWPLTLGPGAAEPLAAATGYKLGTTAVIVFFAVSGFFITKSFDRRSSIADFTVARVARIFPGLFVVLLLSATLLGPLFTELPIGHYLRDPHSWTYLPRNLLLFYGQQYRLPGVFTSNPLPAVNGSLWTLANEAACYVLVAVAGLLRLSRPLTFPLVLGAVLVLALSVPASARDGVVVDHVLILFLPFALGAAAYVYRRRIPQSALLAVALAITAALARGTPAYPLLYAVAVSYGALWFGFAEIPTIKAYNRLGDFSYGIYIYAFPVQQMIVALARPLDPVVLIVASLPPTVLLATLSWHLVESPALARRHVLRRIWSPRGGAVSTQHELPAR